MHTNAPCAVAIITVCMHNNQEEFVIRVLDWTEAVYNGSASVTADRTLASLAHLPQVKLVQLEDFSHYAALVSERLIGAASC